ncbi:hypothetical protein GJAV_G00251970 [Gymnothorax javanicus]|nr:hypothetical protein GJAV_G00251970 [Gymnothorax javanicus]
MLTIISTHSERSSHQCQLRLDNCAQLFQSQEETPGMTTLLRRTERTELHSPFLKYIAKGNHSLAELVKNEKWGRSYQKKPTWATA